MRYVCYATTASTWSGQRSSMAPRQKQQIRVEINPLARVAGRDRPASQVLRDAAARGDKPVQIRSVPLWDDDYTLIDPTLNVLASSSKADLAAPQPGTGYAGFTPQQRHHFLAWLKSPHDAAPPAFQQIYVAYLETALFEEDSTLADEALRELIVLQTRAPWQTCAALSRAVQLGIWLTQSAPRYTNWLEQIGTSGNLSGIALGQLALLQGTLTAPIATFAFHAWQVGPEVPNPDLLQLRLTSLATHLGMEPLAYALAQGAADQCVPQPWRTAHRDIRIALPQPDLRPALEPLLHDMMTAGDSAMPQESMSMQSAFSTEDGETEVSDNSSVVNIGWHIVLEFGQSRSDLFDHALYLARQQPGFSQLMDENRKIVYRILFRKRDQRQFWRLWEYVQNWSDTHVYVNGREVKKGNVHPYSVYMQ